MDLASNALSATIPPSWNTMTNLGALNVSGNTKLCGAGTPSRLLSIVDTSGTSIGAVCESNAYATILLQAKGSGPGSVALLPPSLSRLTELESLLIGGSNGIVGTLPKQWSMLTNLVTLVVADTGATGSLPSEWSSMTALTSLDLGGNAALRGTLPAAWNGLTAIVEMDLAGAAFSGELPAGWAALKSLVALDLSNNKLNATLPPDWTGLDSLTSLIISNNKNALASDASSREHSKAYNRRGLEAWHAQQLASTRPVARSKVTRARSRLAAAPRASAARVEYIIDANKLTTRSNVTAASPVQDCTLPSQITQKTLLADATFFPQPNISQACAPIVFSRRLLSETGEEGAPHQGVTRSLFQADEELPSACQPKATYDLVFLIDPATNMLSLQNMIGSYIKSMRTPACSSNDIEPDFEISTQVRAVNTPEPEGIPVSCPNWTTEAENLLSDALGFTTEVFLDNCFVPPPRPPALPEVPGRPAFPPFSPSPDDSDEIPIAIIGGAIGGVLVALLKKKEKKAEEEEKDAAPSEDSQRSFQNAKNIKNTMEGEGSAAAVIVTPWWGVFCCKAKELDPATGKKYVCNPSISQEDSRSSASNTAPTHDTATSSSAADANVATLIYLNKQGDQEQSTDSCAANSEVVPLVHFSGGEDEEYSTRKHGPPSITTPPDSDSDQAEVFSEHVPAHSAQSVTVPLPARLSDTNSSLQERQRARSTNHLCVSARDIAMKVAESHKNEMVKQKDEADVGSPRLGHTSLVVDADMEVLQQCSTSPRPGSASGSLFASPLDGALFARRMTSISSASSGFHLLDSSSALSPTYSRVSSSIDKGRASAWMESPSSPIAV
eukprot:gene21467-28440_t